jgi:hypothetical protein
MLEDDVKAALRAQRQQLDEKKKNHSVIAQLGSTLSGTMHYILGAQHMEN